MRTRRAAAWCLVLGLVLTVSVARGAGYDEEDFARKTYPVFSVPTNSDGTPIDTIVGDLRLYRVRRGDTLIDLARFFDLGYTEILEANPGIDPWIPPAGATILLPTQYVLPCCTYSGIVVNIPEMRLYLYERPKNQPGTLIVKTLPVGLGRDDWPTPKAKFKVRGKTVNPQWNIPESIRKEHIAERGDPRSFIAGGAPDNPLGKYRIELTLPMYGIHGTDIPWGVGMQVSHGCVRLYPEDIEHLFPMVAVGTPGEFAYQTIKVGKRGDAIFLEAHDDIYSEAPWRYREAETALQARGLATGMGEREILAALEEAAGVPVRMGPGDQRAAAVVTPSSNPVPAPIGQAPLEGN